ncbi:hypothetical protein AAHE18_05G197400 [Arachis hypogaea]
MQRRKIRDVGNHGSDVHDAVEPPGGTANLKRAEARHSGAAREDVPDEESDGADEVIAECSNGVNGNRDGGSVAGEKLRRDAEEELVVPSRVLTAKTIESGSELG